MAVPDAQQSVELMARIIKQVIEPYLAEQQAGQHGMADQTAAMTVILCALARTIVPFIEASCVPGKQPLLIQHLTELIRDGLADWQAAQATGVVGQTLQ